MLTRTHYTREREREKRERKRSLVRFGAAADTSLALAMATAPLVSRPLAQCYAALRFHCTLRRQRISVRRAEKEKEKEKERELMRAEGITVFFKRFCVVRFAARSSCFFTQGLRRHWRTESETALQCADQQCRGETEAHRVQQKERLCFCVREKKSHWQQTPLALPSPCSALGHVHRYNTRKQSHRAGIIRWCPLVSDWNKNAKKKKKVSWCLLHLQPHNFIGLDRLQAALPCPQCHMRAVLHVHRPIDHSCSPFLSAPLASLQQHPTLNNNGQQMLDGRRPEERGQ